jgi:ribose transport system substrate-binding protein
MKKGLMTVAAVAALTLVAGTAAAPVSAADKTLKIYLISKGETHQFWQAVKKGAEEQAAKMNATIVFQGPAAETMIDKQLEMLDAAIAVKPDAIGYAALGTTQAVPKLKAAHDAGIPVYMFDTAASCPGKLGVKSDCALGVAYTNSVAAGKLAADKMAALIGGKGKVLVVGHSQTNQTGIDRANGFINQIKHLSTLKVEMHLRLRKSLAQHLLLTRTSRVSTEPTKVYQLVQDKHSRLQSLRMALLS